MTLSDQLTSDLSIFYDTDEFAETVTYNGSAIPAIVDYKTNLDDAGSRGSAMAIAEISVRASDVAAPAYRDTVVIGSVTWKVRRTLSGDGKEWKLELYRDERPMI